MDALTPPTNRIVPGATRRPARAPGSVVVPGDAHAALDHAPDPPRVLQHSDIPQWIALDDDEVRPLALLDRPDLLPEPEAFRRQARGGLKGLHRGHAGRDQVFELEGVVWMTEIGRAHV